MLFKVNYGGRFQRLPHTEYLRGKKELHHKPWDMDCLSFFKLEAICTKYGYTYGDLIYYAYSIKSLEERLVQILSNMDMLEMVTNHKGHNTIILYMIVFRDKAAHQQEKKKRYKLSMVKKGSMEKGKQVMEDDEEPSKSPPLDSSWDQVVSGEEDVFEDRGDDATSGYQPHTNEDKEMIERRREYKTGERARE